MTTVDDRIREKAALVRLVIFDIDGVMTDGGIYLSEDGREHMRFYIRDGQGIVLLHQAGLMTAVISGRQSAVVGKRMKDLGIGLCFLGQANKTEAFDHIISQHKFSEAQVAYIGDDLTDIPVMQRVGLAIAPQNAHRQTMAVADWVTQTAAGYGAVREACDLILDAHGYDGAALSANPRPKT